MRKLRALSLSLAVGTADRRQPGAQYLDQGRAGNRQEQAQEERTQFLYSKEKGLGGEAAYLSPGAGCVILSVLLASLGLNPASAPGGVGLPAWRFFDCGLSSPQGHYSLLSMTSWPKNVELAHQALAVTRRSKPQRL